MPKGKGASGGGGGGAKGGKSKGAEGGDGQAKAAKGGTAVKVCVHFKSLDGIIKLP